MLAAMHCRYVIGNYKVAGREEALEAKRKGKSVINPGNAFLQAMVIQVMAGCMLHGLWA
jgi:hypothetical protein